MMNTQKPKGIHRTTRQFIGLCLLLLTSVACKKQVTDALPGDKDGVGLNFYMSSDVMNTAYSPAFTTLALYVDRYKEQTQPIAAGTGMKFPTFSFGYVGGLEYPATNSGTNDGSVNYQRYNSGDHRLFLTNINNTVVLDTLIKTSAKTFNGLYLTDEITTAGAPAKYRVVVAQEDRKTVDGKTGVRFIHLSADAGEITCSLQKANGDLTNTQAGQLAFGHVSAYQYFGADEQASGGLIRFTLSNTANGIKFNTGVPFDPGRNYVVVISGFRNEQQRQIATGKNSDGTIKNETITISKGLKAQIRRSY